jgi:hypothetical protein
MGQGSMRTLISWAMVTLAAACTSAPRTETDAADAAVQDAVVPDGVAPDVDAGPPPAPGSPEAMLREVCGARPRTGPTSTVAYATGSPMGVLRGADLGDLEAIRLTFTEPFRLRRVRVNLRGGEGGRARVRITGDIGRTIPDIDRDLVEPVELDVTDQGWREIPIEPPLDLHPAHHAWIVVEHVGEPVGLLVGTKADADGQQGRSRAMISSIVNNRMMNPQGDPWLGLGPMVEYMTEAIGERICPRIGEPSFSDQSAALGPTSTAGRPQWIDVDGDGWDDLAAYRDGRTPMGRVSLWRGRPGFAFEDRTAGLGLDGAAISTGSWADLDADGDLDFYGADYQDGLGPFPPARGSRVFLQGSDGRFAAVDAALEGPGPTNASAFGDCDGDGELDLFVGQWLRTYPTAPGAIALFRGLGLGRFEDVTASAGLPVAMGTLPRGSAPAFSAMWADYDNDGDSDLFVQTYLGAPNWAYVNDGNCRFTERGRSNGFAGTPPVFGTSFGIDFGDYDNDGDLDAFDANIAHARGDLVRIDRSRLLRNSGAPDFRFENVTVDGGILHTEGDHEGIFGDWDNDGDLDLLVSVGPAYGYQWSRLYRQEPDHRFTDVTYLTGFPNLWSTGAMFHDVDRDGDLDLALASSRLTLLRNELRPGAHWIEVRLRDPAGRNRDAIGARITVTSARGIRRIREVTAGRGFLTGQGSLVQHVGLGDESGPVTVEVRWPGATGAMGAMAVTRSEGVMPDRVYLLERGSAPREMPR